MRIDEKGEYVERKIPAFIQLYSIIIVIKAFQLDKQFSRKCKCDFRNYKIQN